MSGYSEIDRRIVFALTARLLSYPDPELLEGAGALASAAERLPREPAVLLAGFLRQLRTHTLVELQAAYVATFDLRRRNCLYLTYHNDGDTRRRGLSLWRFAQVYKERGLSLAGGELPDYLPALLELAASAEEGDTLPFELLVAHRPQLVVLHTSLEADQSVYAGVIRALESALPEPDPAVLEAARKMAEDGPPEEQVGIAPFALEPESEPAFDPELLPSLDPTEVAR